MPMRTFRTVLEQKIRERRLTLLEFVDYAEVFAREHEESGTLSLRHLQRLIAGYGSKGEPLRQLRPATVRLLENIFGHSIDELLSPPAQPILSGDSTAESDRAVYTPSRIGENIAIRSPERITDVRKRNWQLWDTDTPVQAGHLGVDLTGFFDWVDEHAGWIPDTTRRKVTSRLAKMNLQDLIDQHGQRARVSRRQIADALLEYYGDSAQDPSSYRARLGATRDCDEHSYSATLVGSSLSLRPGQRSIDPDQDCV